jgi:lipoate-protein ligase A
MIFYRTGSTDPHFNLAFEEYTVRAAGDETVFMLWQNSPSVIIGRNQNAFAEIDIAFAVDEFDFFS